MDLKIPVHVVESPHGRVLLKTVYLPSTSSRLVEASRAGVSLKQVAVVSVLHKKL